jgi:two-component system LytT family response regulator
MEPIRTVIVDDEPNAREGIFGLLAEHDDIIVVGEARNGREAVSLISRERPELIYLDIQMPELDGFGVLAELRAVDLPIVVFVTAYDAHALRAFEVHALDYLLKPFSDERFDESLTLAKQRVRQRRAGALGQQLAALLQETVAAASEPSGLPSAKPDEPESTSTVGEPYLDRLMIPTAKGTVFIRADQIDWIEADDYYAKLHVAGRTYLLRETMQSLASRLDPKRFVRTHRSAIVNLDRIATLQPYFRGAHVLTLKDGTQVTLSRSRRPDFERAIGGRL